MLPIDFLQLVLVPGKSLVQDFLLLPIEDDGVCFAVLQFAIGKVEFLVAHVIVLAALHDVVEALEVTSRQDGAAEVDEGVEQSVVELGIWFGFSIWIRLAEPDGELKDLAVVRTLTADEGEVSGVCRVEGVDWFGAHVGY